MLEYTTSGDGPSLGLIVHHDDAEREVAYDRDSKIGKLDTAWDEATEKGWIVVSMMDDWNRVFPFDRSRTCVLVEEHGCRRSHRSREIAHEFDRCHSRRRPTATAPG